MHEPKLSDDGRSVLRMLRDAQCIAEKKDNKNGVTRLRIDPCLFHPAGGGQPGDTGSLVVDGQTISVIDTLKDESGIWLVVDGDLRGKIEGTSLKYEIDEKRHRLLARMHSGEHVLSRVLEKKHPGLGIYKVNVGTEETSVYIRYDGLLDWDVFFGAEEEANAIVAQNLQVRVEEHTPETARCLPNLKINWERVGERTVRVVRMGDFDTIACSGSHVAQTGDIGEIFITGFNGSAPEWVFRFTVEGRERSKSYLRHMRSLLRSVGCSVEEIENVFLHAQEEKRELQKTIGHMTPLVRLEWNRAEEGSTKFHFIATPGIPREVVSQAVRRAIRENPEGIYLALLPEGEGGRAGFILARGTLARVNLQDFVRNAQPLGVRGGGKPDWISGIATVADPGVWERTYREYAAKA